MVWAQKSVGVACRKGHECSVGLHEKADAEALLERLASDDDLVVDQRLVVELSSGVTITFEPSP